MIYGLKGIISYGRKNNINSWNFNRRRNIEKCQCSRLFNSDACSYLKIKKTAAEIVKQEDLIVMRTPGVHSFGHRPDGKLIVRTSMPHMVPDFIEGVSVVKEYCEGFIPMSKVIPTAWSIAKTEGPSMLVSNKNLYAVGCDDFRLVVRGSEQGLKMVPEKISGCKVHKRVCEPFMPCGSSVTKTTPRRLNHDNSITVHTFLPGSDEVMAMSAHIACKVRTVENEELLLACGHTHHAPVNLPFKTQFTEADSRASYLLGMEQGARFAVTKLVIMSDNMDLSLSSTSDNPDMNFPTPFTGVAKPVNLMTKKWRYLINGEERDAAFMGENVVSYQPWTAPQYFPNHWRSEENKWTSPALVLQDQLLFSVAINPGESGGVLVDEDNQLLAYEVAQTVEKETGSVVAAFSPVHPIFEKLGLTLVTK